MQAVISALKRSLCVEAEMEIQTPGVGSPLSLGLRHLTTTHLARLTRRKAITPKFNEIMHYCKKWET
jgi:hypothetical protein